MRNLQEQVKKAFSYQKLFWPFTVWINCRPSASNFKSFSQSLEQFFLTVGQNSFGSKIPKSKGWKIAFSYLWSKIFRIIYDQMRSSKSRSYIIQGTAWIMAWIFQARVFNFQGIIWSHIHILMPCSGHYHNGFCSATWGFVSPVNSWFGRAGHHAAQADWWPLGQL